MVRVTQDGEPVDSALVTFAVTSGGGIAPAPVTTGPDGQAEVLWILGPALGTQTATASSTGAASQPLTATALAPPAARIVLQWGESPADLDAHLTGPRPPANRFHVFYGNPCQPGPDTSELTGCQATGQDATLDRDDVDGIGPEIITIAQTAAGTYRFSVHDFSNRLSTESSALSASGATVTLFLGDGTTEVFSVPTGPEGPLPGTLWTVFELDFDDESPISTIGTLDFVQEPTDGGAFLRRDPGAAARTDRGVIEGALQRHDK